VIPLTTRPSPSQTPPHPTTVTRPWMPFQISHPSPPVQTLTPTPTGQINICVTSTDAESAQHLTSRYAEKDEYADFAQDFSVGFNTHNRQSIFHEPIDLSERESVITDPPHINMSSSPADSASCMDYAQIAAVIAEDGADMHTNHKDHMSFLGHHPAAKKPPL
jgi:hypothetical protein